MEPMKLRLLSVQGSLRPDRMALLNSATLQAFSEAPVHVAELALKEFVNQDALYGTPASVLVRLLQRHSNVVHYREFRAKV
jgi:hypothetical protein